jgi:hypothetical protein
MPEFDLLCLRPNFVFWDNNHYYPFYSPLDSVTSRENIEGLTRGRIVFATPPPSDSHAKLEMSASRDEGWSTWNRIM